MEDLEESEPLPKLNRFLKELSNWLTIASIILFVIYGILMIVYEIALDITHIRWTFLGFLGCCVIDVITYWICRFAVHGTQGGERCLLRLVLIIQLVTGLFYVIAPIVAIITYQFTPEGKKDEGEEETEEKELIYEDYKSSEPCLGNHDDLWQCGYVNSVQIACWWMMSAAIPKFLVYYLILRVLKVFGNK